MSPRLLISTMSMFMVFQNNRDDRKSRKSVYRISLLGYVLAVVSYAAAFPVSAPAAISADNTAATIIMYHRFGERDYPSTNVRVEQFEAHIRELQSGPYTVLPLEEIIEAYRAGRELPKHTVAITIDDAYRSVYTEAWPRLRDAQFPFTLFVATDPVDRGLANFLTWDQIREIKAAGGSIGHHTASHLHMVDASAERVVQEIRTASDRYKKELGEVPRVFAYPFGEANLEIRDKIMDAGFIAALGQHSGVAHANADRFYLPRFPFNENFGSVDRLKLAATALPLPVMDVTPRDFSLIVNPPHFGFSVSPEIKSLGRLSCFASPGSGGPAQITRLGDRRIEVRIASAFPAGHARFNCTLPTREGRWRWFGMQFYIPRN
jgi:peptidoglycan/xylan/chitin deacetylase (PgdA/CDA1 family)